MAHVELRQEIVGQLKRTAKYRYLCEDALCRTADWAAARHPKIRAAVKAAKRKLHQVHGAYLGQVDLARVEAVVNGLPGGMSVVDLQGVCKEILGRHASSAERLQIMGDFYPALFREIGQPRSLLDLACGMNPFSLPWMGLPTETWYAAYDVDARLISVVDTFLGRLGQAHEAACRDILVSPPKSEVDVVFLFKSLPCLEQQDKGAGVRLLRELRAPCTVVSFPTRSLGGREKGMVENYEEIMARTVDQLGVCARKMAYPGETFYILQKRG